MSAGWSGHIMRARHIREREVVFEWEVEAAASASKHLDGQDPMPSPRSRRRRIWLVLRFSSKWQVFDWTDRNLCNRLWSWLYQQPLGCYSR